MAGMYYHDPNTPADRAYERIIKRCMKVSVSCTVSRLVACIDECLSQQDHGICNRECVQRAIRIERNAEQDCRELFDASPTEK